MRGLSASRTLIGAHRRHRDLSDHQVHRILRARRRTGDDPDAWDRCLDILGPPCTRWSAATSAPGSPMPIRPRGSPIRYERDRPGELVHVAVKNSLGSPLMGGTGCSVVPRRLDTKEPGWATTSSTWRWTTTRGWRSSRVHLYERGTTTARFLLTAAVFFAERGVARHRSYLDCREFQDALAAIGARHTPTRSIGPRPTARPRGSSR